MIICADFSLLHNLTAAKVSADIVKSYLEFFRLHLFVVSPLNLMLIGRDTELGLLMSFLRVIQHQSE